VAEGTSVAGGTNEASGASDGTSGLRLTKSVRPARYDITVSSDLDEGRFSGRVVIDLEVLEAADELVCNAADIVLADASLEPPAGPVTDLEIRQDADTEKVAFATGSAIPPGSYRLSCAFAGAMNEKLRGFYRAGFTDDNGTKRTVGVTQLCLNDARRVFPCWDEPEFKAVFAVTLELDETLVAVSNTPEVHREPIGAGSVRVAFADTMPMSSYLVAWVVGPLEISGPVIVRGTPIRIVTLPGKGHLTSYPLEVAAHALGWYEDYFGIPYPGDKLDLVAVPEFLAGAMENFGCVTFREDALLCDPAEASIDDVTNVIKTIEHEIAHMWFGDLVTMRWWNGLWLNEAFATFMSLCCLDDFRPELARWNSFGTERQRALGVDALHTTRAIEFPVGRADEAMGMLDVLTYMKGAGVLRMLEQHLGPERFRRGVRHYLAAHSYGSTETTDLWDAIESVTGEPVRALMDGWILQGGSPIVIAEEDAGDLVLSAEPFAFLSASDRPTSDRPSAIGHGWLVPVSVAVLTTDGPPVRPNETTVQLLLASEPVRLSVGTALPVVNAGGSGAYRVRYRGDLYARITSNLSALEAIERFNLVADTWACVLAGSSPLSDFLSLATRVGAGGEEDPDVWSAVIEALGLLHAVAAPQASQDFAAFTRRLVGPALRRVGWEAVAVESSARSRARAKFILALGTVGNDSWVQTQAMTAFRTAVATGAHLPAASASEVLRVVVAAGARPEFEAVREHYRHPSDPIDEQRHLMALSATRAPELVAELLAMSLDEVRPSDAAHLLRSMLQNLAAGDATWRFITDRWEQVVRRLPELSFTSMVAGVASLLQVDGNGALSTAERATDFMRAHPLPDQQQLVDQSLELLAVHVRLVNTYANSIGSLLA
jgi:puromycin-sensitive aminopeptidase